MHVSQIRRAQDTFLTFFPPPKFLEMPAPGIDISHHEVKVVELVRIKKNLTLGQFGVESFPSSLLVRGEIKEPERLVATLKTMRRRFGLRFVRASLPEDKAYFFKVSVPHLAERQDMRNIIEFRIEENVPISAAEAVFDYDFIESNHSEHIDVGVIVYPRHIVEMFLDVFHRADIMPLSFESEMQAIGRAVIPEGDLSTYMIVNIGQSGTGVAVMQRGVFAFTATIDIGGQTFTDALTHGLSIPEEEAKRIKYKEGLSTRDEYRKFSEALTNSVLALSEALSKHYTYWHTRGGESGGPANSIKKIILCGSEACLPGLPEYLSSGINASVIRANVWSNAYSLDEFIPDIYREDSYRYAAAIGLALPHHS